jgi:hypothetical protein
MNGRRPDPEARKAAVEATDPNRLLPGEERDSRLADDVEHWVAVYTELLAAKALILDTTLQQLEKATREEVHQELQGDQTVLLNQIERFQRRLRYWHDREIEISRRQD